jgi:hypothetical protein
MLALALFAIACTARQGVATTVEMQTIASGGYAADDSGRQAVLASSADQYQRLWAEKIGNAPAPEADFSKGVVVFLLAGSRPTGGWSVHPEAVTVTDSVATVRARIQGPGGGSIVTQALTSPYAVVFLQSRDVTSVQWPE